MRIAFAIVLACATLGAATPEPAATVRPVNGLRAEIAMKHAARHVSVTVTVHNGGDAASDLRFTDSGLFALIVTDAAGAPLYDSRAGMMFAQVLRTITIAPGESTTFAAEWEAPPAAGNVLCVRAIVRTLPPLEASGRIDLTQ
ncbi:MAG: hypothetical protein NVSMB19_11910 [Vulcanimicrobiaceae bacterium]